MRTVGPLAKCLPWSSYSGYLNSWLRQIPKKPDIERILVRAVCAVADNFHFDVNIDDDSPFCQKIFIGGIFRQKTIVLRKTVNAGNGSQKITEMDSKDNLPDSANGDLNNEETKEAADLKEEQDLEEGEENETPDTDVLKVRSSVHLGSFHQLP